MSMSNGPYTTSAPREDSRSRDTSPRMFVFESGWHVSIKRGSHREFCHMIAPGQDFYHRLLDGEIYLHHDRERLCLHCAVRRGLISFEPRRLRDPGRPYLSDSSEIPVFDPESDEL